MSLRVPIVALVLLLVGQAGCLIPYPIEERPIEVNYPPFYVDGTISPALEDIIEFDPRVERDVQFRVVLDDPNTSDQLFYRWFINYNPQTGGATNPGRLEPGESVAISQAFRPCLERPTGGEAIHRFTLLVADRPFLQTAGPPVDQRVAAGTGTLELTWFVRLDDNLCSTTLAAP